MPEFQIAVVGCGPGGLAAALFLSRQGHDVTLFERFSAAQPVGSGLLIQPTGQAVLNLHGLLDAAAALASPIERLHGISVTSGRRALDMCYAFGGTPPALGIHRASLFKVLMDAVTAANIPIVVNAKLVSANEDGGKVVPVFKDQGAGEKFDFLIDASGARSPLATGTPKQLSFGAFWATVDLPQSHGVLTHALDQRYTHARKMAGIMPVGFNPATGNQGAAVFWSEKPENAEGVIAAGIGKFRDNFCVLWPEAEPFVSQINSMDELTMATYHHRTGTPRRSHRLIHVGDSWHCTSPQLGQGANMALIDAAALAEAFRLSARPTEVAERYRQARIFHVSLYQNLSWMFTPLYQSDGYVLPFARDMAIHYFARWPLARNLIALIVSGSLGMRALRDVGA